MDATTRMLKTATLILLTFLVAGCSALKVKACLPGATECTVVKTRGESALEQPELVYERELPDGTIIRFRFNAASSKREGITVDQAIADAIVDRLLVPGGN